MGKKHGTHCIGGWLGPRAVLKGGVENFDPNGTPSLHHPACSELL